MAVYAGKGSVFQVTISASLTTVSGMRDIKFDPGEVETMEVDDLASDYVDLDVTGRAGGGTLTGQCFWDPANAQMQALHTLWNTPAKVNMSTTWGTSTESIAFSGILKKLPLTATRTDPITADIECVVAERPTLNES